MIEERDPFLQALFAEAEQTFDDTDFVAGVLARARRRKMVTMLSWGALALVVATLAWPLAPSLEEFGRLVAQTLTSPLIDFGETLPGWLLAPVNNIGSLLVVLLKLMRMGWKRIA